jgi:uncharacterized short protein YbdD (DUF466 family)
MVVYVIGFENGKIVDASHMSYREFEEIKAECRDGAEGYIKHLESKNPKRTYIIHEEI